MRSRAYLDFYLLELKRILTYRMDFWIGFIGNVLAQFGVAYFLWRAIFAARGAEEMQGYTFGALMLYYLLVPLTEKVVSGQEMGFMSGEIYEGGLSRYLLYPISFFRVKFSGRLGTATIYALQMVLVLSIFLAVFRQPFGLSWTGLAMALPVMALAGLAQFCLTACLEMTAFWADNVWSIMAMNRFITHLVGGGLIPLAFFPGSARAALEYTHFPLLISFPIRCMLGQVGALEWAKGMGLTAAWALVFAGVGAALWRKGLKGYSGVGI